MRDNSPLNNISRAQKVFFFVVGLFIYTKVVLFIFRSRFFFFFKKKKGLFIGNVFIIRFFSLFFVVRLKVA